MRYQNKLLVENSALLALFQEQKFSEIGLIYSLFQPIPNGLKILSEKFKNYMVELGRAIIGNCQTQKEGKDLSVKDLLSTTNLIEILSSTV